MIWENNYMLIYNFKIIMIMKQLCSLKVFLRAHYPTELKLLETMNCWDLSSFVKFVLMNVYFLVIFFSSSQENVANLFSILPCLKVLEPTKFQKTLYPIKIRNTEEALMDL